MWWPREAMPLAQGPVPSKALLPLHAHYSQGALSKGALSRSCSAPFLDSEQCSVGALLPWAFAGGSSSSKEKVSSARFSAFAPLPSLTLESSSSPSAQRAYRAPCSTGLGTAAVARASRPPAHPSDFGQARLSAPAIRFAVDTVDRHAPGSLPPRSARTRTPPRHAVDLRHQATPVSCSDARARGASQYGSDWGEFPHARWAESSRHCAKSPSFSRSCSPGARLGAPAVLAASSSRSGSLSKMRRSSSWDRPAGGATPRLSTSPRHVTPRRDRGVGGSFVSPAPHVATRSLTPRRHPSSGRASGCATPRAVGPRQAAKAARELSPGLSSGRATPRGLVPRCATPRTESLRAALTRLATPHGEALSAPCSGSASPSRGRGFPRCSGAMEGTWAPRLLRVASAPSAQSSAGAAASSIISIQDYSADEIGFAVAPRKLELLRRKLLAMQLETRKIRKALDEETAASIGSASNLESNKHRIRQLLDEEAAFVAKRGGAAAECIRNGGDGVASGDQSPGGSVSSRSRTVISSTAAFADALVADARAETEQLAREVIEAASRHTSQLREVRGLRAAARTRRLRQTSEASAMMRNRCASERCRRAQQEVWEASEELAVLRECERELWSEVAVAEGSAIAAAATGRSRTRGPEEAIATLRNELQEEKRSVQAAQELESAECTLEGDVRHEVVALVAHLASSEAGARNLLSAHRDVEAHSENLRFRFDDASRKVSVLRAASGAALATQRKLEAELCHRRSAACAWRARASELEGGQHRLASEISRTANRCRDILSKSFGKGLNHRNGAIDASNRVESPRTSPVRSQTAQQIFEDHLF